MARQPILTPGKSALLMLGLGTMGLMGIPGFGTDLAPVGALAGVVLDETGGPVEGVEVALYDGEGLALIELAVSDAAGRFAFQQAPWLHHVLANPEVESSYLPRWELDRERSDANMLELGLVTGSVETVSVTDPAGNPIHEAEVRVIDSVDDVVTARLLTDENGQVDVVLPADFHLGVLATGHGYSAVWLTDQAATSVSDGIQVEMSEGVWHYGQLTTDQGEPAVGVVVSAWSQVDDEWQWLGYDLSREDGSFQVLGNEHTHVRALDPEHALLPAAWDLKASGEPVTLSLEEGDALLVHCELENPLEDARRVWFFDEESELWSWGVVTDATGNLAVQTSGAETTIVVESTAGDSESTMRTLVPEPGTPIVVEDPGQ